MAREVGGRVGRSMALAQDRDVYFYFGDLQGWESFKNAY